MVILAHMGITLGAAVVLRGSLAKFDSIHARQREVENSRLASDLARSQASPASSKAARLAAIANRIDLRVLLIGSVLADIIDKPVGQVLFRDTFSNGRIFCHTLLFAVVLSVAGFVVYRSRSRTWPLALALGGLAHIVLDQMWREPRTLLWPLYGIAFEKEDVSHYLADVLEGLRTDPGVYVPEVVGAVILVWLLVVLVRRGGVLAFLREGQWGAPG